jgi:hypothetical protein
LEEKEREERVSGDRKALEARGEGVSRLRGKR